MGPAEGNQTCHNNPRTLVAVKNAVVAIPAVVLLDQQFPALVLQAPMLMARMLLARLSQTVESSLSEHYWNRMMNSEQCRRRLVEIHKDSIRHFPDVLAFSALAAVVL